MNAVPPPIEALLVKLDGDSHGYSPELREPLHSIFRNVLRVFHTTPPDEESRSKALRRIAGCLGVARDPQARPADQASVPLLEEMERLLRPPRSPTGTLVLSASELEPPVLSPPVASSAAWGAAPLAAPAADAPPPAWAPAPRIHQPPPPHGPLAPSPRSRPPRHPPLADPNSLQTLASRLLEKLAGLSAKRRHMMADPLTTWADLVATEREIDLATRSLTWIGPPAAAFAEQELQVAVAAPGAGGVSDADVPDDDEIFATAIALLRTGHAEILLRHLAPGGAAAVRDSAGAWAALRLAASDHLSAIGTLAAETAAALPPALLDILADHALVIADQLVAHLDGVDDRVASRAAELLAWLGRSPTDTGALERRLTGDLPLARRPSFLFAAAMLGSPGALAELRAAADAGAPPASALAIDILVAAGTPADAERLRRWRDFDSPLAPLTALALAHLGAPDRALLGRGPTWTRADVPTLLGRHQSLCARRWHALAVLWQGRARPIGALDPAAPAAIQEMVVTELTARLPP